ncbi:hypothetical protein [Croceicoccus mobilis]|uniref:Uncharacterized protein n=1 Tax=Croceicoccus mobilis TaxID=1703339 RepID=A0A917DUU3_9SPHN|nr:hypothetical protein [Croceicoccus mobilis]GGD73192.1 hypothetical protein GCM10010990_23500 [Croceicoccus mobilis]
MSDFMAMAPVLAFSALVLGAAIVIGVLLREMAGMFEQIAGGELPAANAAAMPRTAFQEDGDTVVALPRRSGGRAVTMQQLRAAA